MGTTLEGVSEKVKTLRATALELERELERVRMGQIDALARDLLMRSEEVSASGGNLRLVVSRQDSMDVGEMRALGDRLKAGGAGAIILGSVRSGRPTLVVMVAAEAASSGVDAVAIVRKGAGVMGGSGGGKPEMAQAGGKVPEALDKALASAKEEAIRLITRNSREGGE